MTTRAAYQANPFAALHRWSRLAACAMLIGLAIGNVAWAMTDWELIDMWVYWRAAEQWQAVGNPYALLDATDATSVYRYSPWFAALFVPLTWVDPLLVAVGWATVMTLASIFAVVPLYRAAPGLEGFAAAFFFGSILFGFRGNVHPLLVCALVWGIPRRSGPVWVALAASLKVVPILYLLIYAARREWGKVAVGVALTGLLIAPMLLYERPAMSLDPGPSNSLWMNGPLVWGAAALASVLAACVFAYRRSEWTWLAAGGAACMALPRAFVYDVTFVLPGTLPFRPEPSGAKASAEITSPAQPTYGSTAAVPPSLNEVSGE